MDVETSHGILKKRMEFIPAALSPEGVSILLLEKSGGAVCPGTAPRIKVPPFSETDRGHSYSGRETDSTLLVRQALYNCSGPPTLAQKAA